MTNQTTIPPGIPEPQINSRREF